MTDTVEELAQELGLTTDEFLARATAFRFGAAVERLSAMGAPSYEDYAAAARGLGLPLEVFEVVEVLRARVEGVRGEVGFSYDPITEDELTSENLAPAWLVENYLYRDLAVLSGPGGTSKTTLCLWEAAHIALGRQVYGLTTRASSTRYG